MLRYKIVREKEFGFLIIFIGSYRKVIYDLRIVFWGFMGVIFRFLSFKL